MTRGEGADLPSNDTPSAPSAGRRFWINTVSLDHVEGAIEGGFTQADHGANTRLHRPRPGDLMIFYSPRTNLHSGIPVRQFTALATVTDNKPYRVTLSKDFQPWRLAVQFHPCTRIDARPLVDQLSFVKDPSHWGLPFRRGLFTIPQDDFSLISDRMRPVGPSVTP
jgi:hypothetical protein